MFLTELVKLLASCLSTGGLPLYFEYVRCFLPYLFFFVREDTLLSLWQQTNLVTSITEVAKLLLIGFINH